MRKYKVFSALAGMLLLGLAGCNDAPQSTEETEMDAPTEQFGGLALYTLRDTMGTAPKEVLKKVAGIGYQYIEAAGYADGKFYGMEPAAFKSYLGEIGLIPDDQYERRSGRDHEHHQYHRRKVRGGRVAVPLP